MAAGSFSRWPGPIVLAAVKDPELTRRHADIVRREYRAVGMHAALHPQADLATEPRWSQISGTFGEDAQSAAATVLTSGEAGVGSLPLTRRLKVYAEVATVVPTPDEADVALLRLQAPYEQRSGTFEMFFHAGSLEFDDETVDHVRSVATIVPTMVDVFLDRPAVLTPVAETAASLVASFGASDRALLRVLFCERPAEGTLPFDVPRTMESVTAGQSDVPFDSVDPLFRFGHGIRLDEGS